MESRNMFNYYSRDYNSISPSAWSILFLKALTDIPFASEAAKLVKDSVENIFDLKSNGLAFWARIVHFENRYWSINQLMADIPILNILELSSGFSFRGLDITSRLESHYIDTDLPEIIKAKANIVNELQKNGVKKKGRLELLPLNVLDSKRFEETTNHFSSGEIVIVNEGLLMYLSNDEKSELCRSVRASLEKYKGYWITADIYIKKQFVEMNKIAQDKLSDFFQQHRIEENMFESFEEAEAFFDKEGFSIDKEAEADISKLSALPRMLEIATPEQLKMMQASAKFQASWRLKLKGK